MRIVYLHQYFVSPDMAGGTRSYEMARRMVAAGHEVHIVTSRTDGKMAGGWVKTEVAGINVHWLPVAYNNSMSIARRLRAFLEFAIKAGPRAASLEPDVIFATSTPLTIAIPAIWAKKRRKVPMVFEVRDLWPEVPIAMGAIKNPVLKWAARKLESWAYANSAQVVALSPGMAEGIRRAGYPEDRITCIPNSADVEIFDIPSEVGESFRAEREWLQDRPLLVYAGTFGRVNGIGYMVELAKEMAAINPEFRFLAIGNGAEEAQIRQAAEAVGVLNTNFFIEPPVSKSDLPRVLSAASVASSFVIPIEELWKNSANKFFDTLAAGRPMVINYGGWQADILKESGAGIELPYDNAREAALQLNSLVSDEKRMSLARKAAAKLAHETFAREKLAKNLISVIETAAL